MVTIKRRLAESARVEAFSDGVFAVAITLLVLELHAPEGKGEFLSELLAQWQTYVAYLAAFLVIGVVWMTHHSLFTRIGRVNSRLIAQNLLQLLLASLVPFAAGVVSDSQRMGERSDQVVAVALFALISIALSLSWYWLSWYVEKTPELLIDPSEIPALGRSRRAQLFTIFPPIAAFMLAFLSPLLALAILGVLPLFYLGSILRTERGIE
ncbi:TMEM175 family protein [Glaciihabitans sp. INWT7]|uniref:TMEM175 family protein n=1 Tax=Glaciihabitans sp. INWT7 TaxID=2596912 RepID=UPI001624869D|nr:TMEM175 family protein [Glaciihabitans sp. INWT7]